MIDYTLVSMGAMLRDYITVKYLNKEHQMLCDMADYFYNATISRDPEKESANMLRITALQGWLPPPRV